MASQFNFSKETPPDAMFTDIQTLNKFKDEQFTELTVIVLAFLMEPSKSARLLSQLDEFAERHGVSGPGLKNVCKSLIAVPNSAIQKGLSADQIKEDLVNLGLSEDKASSFSAQWQTNLSSLTQGAARLMVNQLVDMEWKFGVTAASSESNKVGSTFLQLKMVVNKGDNNENVYLELTLPQFYSFLHEMEKAKSSLEYFTSS